MRQGGDAEPVRPSIVPAATSAFTTASSVAWATASNNGESRSFGCMATVRAAGPWSTLRSPRFGVEKAMKMSPEPSLAIEPSRPSPSDGRFASRRNWCGSSGVGGHHYDDRAKKLKKEWCPRSDSNRHSLRNSILSRARLPIPPQGPEAGVRAVPGNWEPLFRDQAKTSAGSVPFRSAEIGWGRASFETHEQENDERTRYGMKFRR